ncbi:MAG: pilus assembly protein PilM [Desulfobacterales bacterium]|nr:pilus assembly protein PilM [Desulfobacterales bacterium]
MSRLNETTSTEKLLNFIRNKKIDTASTSLDISKIDSQAKKPSNASLKIVSEKKPVNIDIDIGHDYLSLVKTTRLADKSWVFLGCKSTALTHSDSKKSPEFINFVKSELENFIGADKDVNLWANMSAAHVNVRHLKIPKVPKNQIENTISWAIKRETPFDDKDMSLDFEILGEITEDNLPKLSIIAYTAPKDEVKDTKILFSEIDLPLNGISIAPFAVQNILKTIPIPAHEGTVASLFIGNDFSRIDIYADGKLVMTRGIRAGIKSMIEALMEKISEESQEPEEVFEMEGPSARLRAQGVRKALFSLSPDSPPLTEKDIGFKFTEEEKFNAIILSLERVVRQVERTFEYYTTTLKYDRVDRIYVSSVMNVYMPIVKYVGDQLGIESDVLDPLKFHLQGCEGYAEKTCISDRVSLIPALGLALSDNEYTPNLLFRFKDKEKHANTLRITNAVFAVLIVVALICGGVFFYQNQIINQKKAAIIQLEGRLSQYKTLADQGKIFRMVDGLKEQQRISKTYSERYLGMAIISELSSLTPKNIRLISLKAYMGSVAQEELPKKDIKKNLLLEGLVFGDRNTLESSLAGFIMKLKESPMLRQISIQKNSIEPFRKDDVLHFIIDITLTDL